MLSGYKNYINMLGGYKNKNSIWRRRMMKGYLEVVKENFQLVDIRV